MPKRNKLRNSLKLGNVATMIKNQAIRAKFLFCIEPTGNCYYLFKGMVLTKREMDILYPVEPKFSHIKGRLPDERIKSIYL